MKKQIPIEVADDAAASMYVSERKIHPRDVDGRFQRLRAIAVWVLLGMYYVFPWLNWDGRQSVLFDLPARKFYVFWLNFWPQDFVFLAMLLIIAGLALFFFTALAGRLWCGYACPQTVWTEVFIWIELKLEGDRGKRMKLDSSPWTAEKIRRRGSKHVAWLLFALWTGFTFVGFFTPIRELADRLVPFAWSGWETFWVLFYALATWGNAGFLREQVCKYMCPYARFQGVMFDPDTLIISYDPERGEPRGGRRKGTVASTAKPLGDCVDCSICVQVCPTGIDIRNGLQLECIACAACIDACDQVMDKVGSPRGLIRYSTENALAKHYTVSEMFSHLLRPRTLLYSSILLAIVLAAAWSLAHRVPLKVDVLRDRSTLSREADDGRIENVFRLHISNTDEAPHRYSINVSGIDGIDIVGERSVELPSASSKTVALSARVEPAAGKKGSNPIFFEVRAEQNEKIAVREKTSFFLP